MNHIEQHREYAVRLAAHGWTKEASEQDKEPDVCSKCRVRPAIKTDGKDIPICKQCDLSKTKPIVRHGPRIGRNEPCPCGSGKKFKLCHLLKIRQ